MTRKWILAVAASVGLALASTPLWLDRGSAREVDAGPGGGSASFCDAQAKPAPLDQTIKDMNGKDVVSCIDPENDLGCSENPQMLVKLTWNCASNQSAIPIPD